MSFRKAHVILSPQAQEDYEDILLHSLVTWGDEQALAYEEAIERVLRELGNFPEMGRIQDELFPGCRSFPVEQHVIYYHVDAHAVMIDRILHGKMDAKSHLDEL